MFCLHPCERGNFPTSIIIIVLGNRYATSVLSCFNETHKQVANNPLNYSGQVCVYKYSFS